MTSTPPNDWNTFRQLCHVLGCRDPIQPPQQSTSSTLPALIQAAKNHNILPSLAERLLVGGLECQDSQIGDVKVLKDSLRNNTVRNLQIMQQAIGISRCLNEENIFPMFLKGTGLLLNSEMRHIGERHQTDIDILIPETDMTTSIDLLIQDGYQFCIFDAQTNKTTRRFTDLHEALELSKLHRHLPSLIKDHTPVVIEVHRQPLPRRFDGKLSAHTLLAEANFRKHHGISYLTPSAEHQLALLILGNFIHDGHAARKNFPLREACDFLAITAQNKTLLDDSQLARTCGSRLPLFSELVKVLMREPLDTDIGSLSISRKTDRFLWLQRKRYQSAGAAWALNQYARANHLAHTLVSNPRKLHGRINLRSIIW